MTDPTPHDAPNLEDAAARAASDERREGRDRPNLGRTLRDARERSGLGLSDLAEVTHVRRVYLTALEEGRYRDLPEDVYTRNFVRLYANAVGLDSAPLLDQYVRERQAALGRTTLETRLEHDRRAATNLQTGRTAPAPARRRAAAPAWLSGPWLPTLALVVVVVGLAVWGFNNLLDARPTAATPAPAAPTATDPTDVAAPEAPGAGASLAAPQAGEAVTDGPSQVLVSIVTDPPGASVTIDGFPVPGFTPLVGVPVTARDGRVVRAELDGFEVGEVRADLRQDAELVLSLEPIGAADAPGPGAVGAVAGAEGVLTISVTDTAWLEVYRSTARNEGERLVYTTAQPGATYSFAPPVFVYTGNAAGVRLNLAGQDLGPMGSPGAVLGRAFPQ